MNVIIFLATKPAETQLTTLGQQDFLSSLQYYLLHDLNQY